MFVCVTEIALSVLKTMSLPESPLAMKVSSSEKAINVVVELADGRRLLHSVPKDGHGPRFQGEEVSYLTAGRSWSSLAAMECLVSAHSPDPGSLAIELWRRSRESRPIWSWTCEAPGLLTTPTLSQYFLDGGDPNVYASWESAGTDGLRSVHVSRLFVSTGGIQRTFVSDVSIRGSTSNSYSLCPVRDISGDLISDFVIANPGGNDGRGTLHICSGADGALIGTVDGPEGVQPGAFGGFISNCGDWDLDGRDELLVSSPDLERNSPQLIILDLAKKKTLRTLSAVGKSNGFLDSFLTTAQCIGDMSGDGVPDIALCWAQHSESGGGKREGEVQVISGANGDLLQRMLGRQVHEYLGLGLEIIDRGPGYCHIALMSSRELLYVDIRSR